MLTFILIARLDGREKTGQLPNFPSREPPDGGQSRRNQTHVFPASPTRPQGGAGRTFGHLTGLDLGRGSKSGTN